jgi:hypothetical protein
MSDEVPPALAEWRANLRKYDRAGARIGSSLHGCTVWGKARLDSTDDEDDWWVVFADADPEAEIEGCTTTYRLRWLEPLPDPEATGLVYAPPPPVRRGARPRRRATA